MSTTTTHDAEVEQIVQYVFSTMLGIDVVRMPDSAPPDRDTLATSVQITGEWVACVVLSLSRPVARAATAAMLTMPAAEVTDADQQEVAAELVNMIGGNLKSLLPGPSSLSLPFVTAGREFGIRVHDAQLIDDLWFGSDGGFMRVRVFEKTAG